MEQVCCAPIVRGVLQAILVDIVSNATEVTALKDIAQIGVLVVDSQIVRGAWHTHVR